MQNLLDKDSPAFGENDMYFESLQDYQDFGTLSMRTKWKYGVPCESKSFSKKMLSSLDGTCLYCFDELWSQEKACVENSLDICNHLQGVVFQNVLEHSILNLLPRIQSKVAFIYDSVESARPIVERFLALNPSCRKLFLLIKNCDESQLLKWIGTQKNITSLSLILPIDGLDFRKLLSAAPSIKSLGIEIPTSIFEQSPTDYHALRKSLAQLATTIEQARIKKLTILNYHSHIPIVEPLLCRKSAFCHLETLLIDSAFFSDNAATFLFENRCLSHCKFVKLENCEFESLSALIKVLDSFPYLQGVSLAGARFVSLSKTTRHSPSARRFLTKIDLSDLEIEPELGELIGELIPPKLEFFSCNSSEFKNSAEAFLANSLSKCTRIRHIDISNSDEPGQILFDNLPVQLRRCEFIGVRNQNEISSSQLFRQFPLGIATFYSDMIKDEWQRFGLLGRCSVHNLLLSDESSPESICLSTRFSREFLLQICMPQLDLSDEQYCADLRSFKNLRLAIGNVDSCRRLFQMIVVPSYLMMIQGEMLDYLSKFD